MVEELKIKDGKQTVAALRADRFRYSGNPNGFAESTTFGWFYPPKGRRYVVAFLYSKGTALDLLNENVSGFTGHHTEIKGSLKRRGLLVEQKGE